ncbi:MAG: hypothetical protein KDC92_12935 [Bacteroidetes bacterium]|nr:hypothetical protein [Bacteroidota bacterium]
MISLSDKQINEVYDHLINKGITYPPLIDELLDHLCCLIEEQMEQGAQFQQAFLQAIKQFGPSGIERTQEATIFLLTLQLRKMKKTASILGIIGGVTTILGTLFKVMHWPGANVMLLSGLVITALLFMPFALYVNYKTNQGIRDRATLIAGFTGGILLFVFALFKIMHWPGASALLILSLGELILVFVPLYFVKSYRNKDNRWFDIGSLTVIMSSIIMVLTLYSFNSPSSGYLAAISNLQQQSIQNYISLENQIAASRNELVKMSPDLGDRAQIMFHANKLVTRAFYQYRNQLLSPQYQPDFQYYNQTVQMLQNLAVSKYANWASLYAAVEGLNHGEISQKHHYLIKILDAFPKLMQEISGQNLEPKNVDMAKSISLLPVPEQMGYTSGLLYVNYLNLAEFEFGQFHLELLKMMKNG